MKRGEREIPMMSSCECSELHITFSAVWHVLIKFPLRGRIYKNGNQPFVFLSAFLSFSHFLPFPCPCSLSFPFFCLYLILRNALWSNTQIQIFWGYDILGHWQLRNLQSGKEGRKVSRETEGNKAWRKAGGKRKGDYERIPILGRYNLFSRNEKDMKGELYERNDTNHCVEKSNGRKEKRKKGYAPVR